MKKIIGVLLFIVLMLPVLSLAAYPSELEETENYDGLIELISNEAALEVDMQEDDVYQIDKEVVIDQMIDGNVYVMAETLKIEGAMIYGNIFAMARNIEIRDSEINGSVFVMGENIDLYGTMNDLYAVANKVTLQEDTSIWRSARVVCENLDIKGSIGKNLYATVENLSISDTATIQGALNYYAKTEGDISENAQIGETEFVQLQETEKQVYTKTAGDYISEFLKVAFRALVISLLVIFLVQKFKTLPREKVTTDFLKSAGKGIGVLIALPILSVILMFSVIGTGLGVCLLAIYGILLYIATSVCAVEIAYRIEKENNAKIIGISVLTAIGFGVIGLIPVLGGIIKFIVLLIGLGILFDMLFKKIKQDNGEKNEN